MLNSVDCEIAFTYKDKWCSITLEHGISVSFGDITKSYTSADVAINDPIWDGKTLLEIFSK